MSNHAALNALFLQIGNLPQCQTVALGDGTSGAGFLNLLSGQVVFRRVENASQDEAAQENLQARPLEVSCLGVNGEHATVRLDIGGAQKLLHVWTKQAEALGLF